MQYINNENVYLDNIPQHPSKAGYFKVPYFDGLWVTRSGEFYSDHKEKTLVIHMTKRGYPTIRVQGQNRYVHILLASTFIEKPKDVATPWVNHRDGNKHNFELHNLEWSTPSNNLLHAFKNDLRQDNRKVMLKDLVTGEVKRFNGLNECARFIGKNAARPSEYLNGCNNTPLYGRYDLIWEGDNWNGFTKEDLNRVRPGVPRPIVAVCDKNGSITIYGSGSEAAAALKLSRPEITTRANEVPLVSYKGYIFQWLADWILKGNTINRPPGLKKPE